MKSCYFLVVLTVLLASHGDGRPQRDLVSSSQHKIIQKRHVPLHVRKQYIDTYGGNSVMSGNPVNQNFGETMSQQNYIEDTDNGQQANIANTLQGGGISLNNGLTQNDMSQSQMGSMSNDLVDSSEGTEGRQMIGNGFMQGGGLDISPSGASNLGGSLDGSNIGGGLSAGLAGGSLEGGGLGAGLGGGTSLGLGGGTIEMGERGQGMGALNDGVGGIGGAGLGGGSVETIGGGSLGDESLGNNGIGGSFGDGSNLGGGNLGNNGIEGGSVSGNIGNIGTADLNGLGDLGAGLGGNFGNVGGLGGGNNAINDGLAGLGGTSGGNIGDGLGLEALGSRIAAGSKVQNLGPLGGAHHVPNFASLTGNEGLLTGMQSNHQTPLDMQLSNAADENPSMIPAGLASLMPGKTVHAHVSDKPTSNRPAISGPSMNAALQVEEQARKQHQKRLEALKLKLKTLRKKLEALQRSGDKQDTITNTQQNVNKEEINTLNELRLATQDAIKELHTDYPHAKKKQETAQPKHESLGSKLKTVDFTAKETGDTLEELLKLLDPELQDKKRGKVNKINNTRLDDDAESKLALLTKKAEDEVDKLASQNPKPKTVPQATKHEKTRKVTKQKLSTSWKGLLDSNKEKVEKRLSKMAKTKSSTKPKNPLKYKKLGCWRDDPDRIVPSLENTSKLLNDGYRVRRASVKKCAQVAKNQGFKGFAVENGGQCFSGDKLLQRYKKYGRSRDCANDGRGGDYAMNVYAFT